MTDEEHVLRWARETWRAAPSADSEVERGADRVAQRFAVPKRAWTVKSWATAGATAAVIGALVHAGGSRLVLRSSPPGATAVSVELPAPIPTQVPGKVSAPSSEPPRAAASAEAAVGSPAPNARSHRHTETPRPSERDSAEPSWIDVNDALAALDHAHAEKLLNELALRGHDANTRAKAYLGLAQLEEARQNCEAARGHALRAAAMPEVEIKTIRRALELAARCAR